MKSHVLSTKKKTFLNFNKKSKKKLALLGNKFIFA